MWGIFMKSVSKLILSVTFLGIFLPTQAGPVEWVLNHKGKTIALTSAAAACGGLYWLKQKLSYRIRCLQYALVPFDQRPMDLWPNNIRSGQLPREFFDDSDGTKVSRYGVHIQFGTEPQLKTICHKTLRDLQSDLHKEMLSWEQNPSIQDVKIIPFIVVSTNNPLIIMFAGTMVPFQPVKHNFNAFRFFKQTHQQQCDELEETVLKKLLKKGQHLTFARDGKLVKVTVK